MATNPPGYMRDWHERNPGKQAEYSASYRSTANGRETAAARRLRNRRWSWEYRKTVGCVDCALRDPRVLEFDHINGKTAEVSNMVRDGMSLDSIIAEAARCEVRCRNCHFIITLERQNAYSHRWATEGVPWENGSQKK